MSHKISAEFIENAIEKAVKAGIEAGRTMAAEDQGKFNAYKATEQRLYNLNDLKDKLAEDRERMKELQAEGPRGHSKDIARFSHSTQRLTTEEILDALIQDILTVIAKTEVEIKTVEKALDVVAKDPYYRALTGKYFDRLNDIELAEQMDCDKATVWRNRSRLVNRVSVRLYGVDAMQ